MLATTSPADFREKMTGDCGAVVWRSYVTSPTRAREVTARREKRRSVALRKLVNALGRESRKLAETMGER